MIGTGVFTSLGFQLLEIQSGFVLLMLWAVGGVLALCGALCYAELGAALPRSGGEYNFLTQIYHPMAGFISGWVSATVGFAAPTALAALTFGSYFSSVFPWFSPIALASGLLVLLTAAHCTSHANSGGLQSLLTVMKLALILCFSLLAFALVDTPQPIEFSPVSGDGALLVGGSFAVSLIYVNYAYSGWNAATYISGELRNPQRHLPLILGISTILVTLCYLLLNYVFLYSAPIDAMAGKVEVGYVAAQYVFGDTGASIMGCLLALLLISTVSAMILAGPRVLHAIGQDFPIFRALAVSNANGVPSRAIVLQCAVSLLFLWTASFESILIFAGATMALNTFFAVLGVFVLRWKRPDLPRPYKTWLYPLPPIVFLGLTGWTLVYTVVQRPTEALMCLGIITSGAVFYLISVYLGR
ncbi:MAG: APA family basic amino acid/polyamine antiporter [Halioglobus sp.]|jgi:APA family basic amino acid/polyamine antiporter